MRRHDEGGALSDRLGLDECRDPFAALVVQARRGLVGKNHRWPVDHGAGERDPLRLTVGEGGRTHVPEFRHVEIFQHLPAPRAVFGQAGEVAGEAEVVEDAQGVEEVEALQQQPDGAPPESVSSGCGKAREILPGNANAPGTRCREPRQQVQEGALARARRSGDEAALPGVHPPLGNVENVPAAMTVPKRLDLDHGLRHEGVRFRAASRTDC